MKIKLKKIYRAELKCLLGVLEEELHPVINEAPLQQLSRIFVKKMHDRLKVQYYRNLSDSLLLLSFSHEEILCLKDIFSHAIPLRLQAFERALHEEEYKQKLKQEILSYNLKSIQ